jgi:hypothetical protein
MVRQQFLNGTRDKDSGLWRFPLEEPTPCKTLPQHTAHNVYDKKSIQDTISYLHACCFSPVQYTWIKDIEDGQFVTWPSLMVDNVHKYLLKYDTMVKCHVNQIRQHIRSTKTTLADPMPEP